MLRSSTLSALAVVAALVSTSSIVAQEAAGLVYGVHDIELGDGVDAEKFEKFIVSEFAPAWKAPRNGMRLSILKGDRGARKGKYQYVYVFESVNTRDKFFPPETKQPSKLFRETMQPVATVMQGMRDFQIKRTSYTDYTPVGTYSPIKQGSTPVIAVRNIELAEDVDADTFEEFVKERFAPAWKDPRNGLQMVFTKGLRGAREGKYQFIWLFDSIETRDRYFPEEGGDSAGKLEAELAQVQDVMQELQEFSFSGSSYTDYYPLNAASEGKQAATEEEE